MMKAVRHKHQSSDLKKELKTIIEEGEVNQLEEFLHKHKSYIAQYDLLNSSLDNKDSMSLHFVPKKIEGDDDDENEKTNYENLNSVRKTRILIENGADVLKEDLTGRTILHIA